MPGETSVVAKQLLEMVERVKTARQIGLTDLSNQAKPGTLLHQVLGAYNKGRAAGVEPKYLCLHPDTVQRKGEAYVQAVAEAVDCTLIQSPYIPPEQALLMAEGAELDFGKGFQP